MYDEEEAQTQLKHNEVTAHSMQSQKIWIAQIDALTHRG